MRNEQDPEERRTAIPIGPRVEAVLQLAYQARKPVLLEGPSGIGKSEILGLTAAKLGIDLVVLDLSLLEPPDLVGLPVIAEGITRYACPSALPRGGEGLLLLEELNRAERYVQQPALQLLTSRRLHEYVLPEGWSVVAAINPEDQAYQINPLDPALRDRFLQLRVRADRTAWLSWARQQGLHPGVLQIALRHDRLFDEVSPRSWKHVSDVLRLLGRASERSEHLVRDTLGGYLPSVWIDALLATRGSWREVAGLEAYRLLAGYAHDLGLQTRLAGYLRAGRTDLIEAVTYGVEALLVDDVEVAALMARREIDLSSFERLLKDLPGDQAERLQTSFGANPRLAALLELGPIEVLKGYPGSKAADTVERWLSGRLTRHRAWVLANAVERHLAQQPDVAALLENPDARHGLSCLLGQLGAEGGRSLQVRLQRLGLVPSPRVSRPLRVRGR